MPFTFIPSSPFCESRNRCDLLQRSLGITRKFPIDSLACPFLYCSCDLYHYDRCYSRSNVSNRNKPYCARSPSSFSQRYSRMGICLRCRRKHFCIICHWRDGFEIRHWKSTTFVRIPSNHPSFIDSLPFFWVDFS